MSFQNPVVEVRTQAEHCCMAKPSPVRVSSTMPHPALLQVPEHLQVLLHRCVQTSQKPHPSNPPAGTSSRKLQQENHVRDVLWKLAHLQGCAPGGITANGRPLSQSWDFPASSCTSHNAFFDFEYWQHISSVQYPSNTISNICFKIKHYLSLPEQNSVFYQNN